MVTQAYAYDAGQGKFPKVEGRSSPALSEKEGPLAGSEERIQHTRHS